MKKWDDDNRLKSYVNKVLNAKPVVHTHNVYSRETDFSSHASCRSNKSENIKESVLYKQLQEYNLQQYANKLSLRGYGHGLQGLATQNSEVQNKLLEEIKLLPGHKQKFTDLFKYLVDHPRGAFTPTSVLEKKMTALASFGIYTHNQMQEIPKPIFAKKQSQRHITPVRDSSINRQLLPKLQKPTSQTRKSQEKKLKSREKSNQLIHQKNEIVQINKKENKTKKTKAQDDIILVTEFRGNKPQTAINTKLMNNLQKVFTQDSNINLQLDQIKLMYQSFEGGRLCSTLINIDIEEICNCLASAIQKLMKVPEEVNQIEDSPNYQPYKKETVEKVEKEEEFNQYEEEFFDDEELPDKEPQEEEEEGQIMESQFSLDTTEVIDDQKLFMSVFTDKSLPNVKPSIEVIQNYCKNIMITTKMEREVAIIAMIYVEKLQTKGQIDLTCFNWQKILFTSLIIASKIWDDESFENNNFAKVLPQFSTIQINEMEKIFLRIIDYNLYVKQGDYAKQYFMLRAFADKKKRSFPLKQLDLQTVMILQKRSERIIAKAQFNGTMNKSF